MPGGGPGLRRVLEVENIFHDKYVWLLNFRFSKQNEFIRVLTEDAILYHCAYPRHN